MIESEAERIIALNHDGSGSNFLDPDLISTTVDEINTFTEAVIAKIEDFESVTNTESLIQVTKTLLAGKIELLRNSGTEEQFAEFERRLTLAAIDELWMQHIDRMAHLREEVAFE